MNRERRIWLPRLLVPTAGLVVGGAILAQSWFVKSIWTNIGAVTFLVVWALGAFCAGRESLTISIIPKSIRLWGALAVLGFLGQLITLVVAGRTIQEHDFVWVWSEPLGSLLILMGGSLRLWAIRANPAFFAGWDSQMRIRQIIRSGPYRVMRHPGYIGAAAMLVGAIGLKTSVPTITFALLGISGYIGLARIETSRLASVGT